MSELRIVGLALIIMGILSFSYEGLISYKTRDKVIDAGPVQVTTEKTKTISVPPVLGAMCFIGGVTLLVASVKKPGANPA